MTTITNLKNLPEVLLNQDQNIIRENSLELFEDISFDDLLSFESQLYEDRTFAIIHPIGLKIFHIIQNWNTFISFENISYYHARKLDPGRRPFLDQEMLKAPLNITSHGRYNAIGESCYYIAETKDGATMEITKHNKNSKPVIQVVGLKPIKSIKMIDLSADQNGTNKFLDHLRFTADKENGKIVKEYLLPNFVASCCKKVGIEGIKYKSTGYNCCVLWKDNYFEFVEGSREITPP